MTIGPSSRSGRPLASVVIPAHNEEHVIGRCLSVLLDGAPSGALEVVVVANACTDGTAEFARRFGVQVVEVPTPGKTNALNFGDTHATVFPRFYLDADLELTFESLAETVHVMESENALAASPELKWSPEGLSRAVAAYYRVWERMPYGSGSLPGGLYALSSDGRARFGAFPDIIADDLFVQSLFRPQERKRVHTASFLVHPPRTVRALVQTQARARLGNAELRARGRHEGTVGTSSTGAVLTRLRAVARVPSVWLLLPVHGAIYSLVRLRTRRLIRLGERTWSRDETARQDGAGGDGDISRSSDLEG